MAIKRILGRENELLIAPSGKKYTGHHFTMFCNPTRTPQLKNSIEKFQVIQHPDVSVTMRFVVNDKYDTQVEQYVINYWSKEVEVSADVQIVYRMPIVNNNKQRFIIIEK